MPTGSTTLHEADDRLSSATKDMHRTIVSLMEELEAVDWYQQRMEATTDTELRDILRHNRDEEKEHAAMVLEWIRRHDPRFDEKLKEYLFTDGSIVGRERAAEAGAVAGAVAAAANGNEIRGNAIYGHVQSGLFVGLGTINNTIEGNRVLLNGVDLTDANPGCDANVWQDNTFDTAQSDVACID